MNNKKNNKCRQILHPSTIIVGIMFTLTLFTSCIGKKPSPSNYSSTSHFWYFRPDSNIYIDSQKGKRAFAFSDDGTIYLSKNNSRSWFRKLAFPDAKNITFSHLFENGNILFATRTKLFLSKDNLKTYKEIIVKDKNGRDYLPHTPQDPDKPGWYFYSLSGVNAWKIDGKEMLVWGNYCNVIDGPAPVNIYYSTDYGETVKIAYSFGQNPYFQESKSATDGSDKGILLGDPHNPVICRHVHSVAYNDHENAFYACTGDQNRSEGFECHWLRGTYDTTMDSWDWQVIISEKLNSRYKSGGINFVNGKVYWVSDANGPKPHDRGVFCCDPKDIPYPEKHTLLYDLKYESGTMLIQDDIILVTLYAVASPYTLGIIVSTDLGKSWTEYDIKDFGARSPLCIHPKNNEGWFRMDLRTRWIDRTDVLFLKMKK